MRAPPLRIEACILAGGLSRRMGRDKSRLRLGGRTLLGHAKALAATAGLPVRVSRDDTVARCGPLGGILTALQSSDADALIFLACDMPFVPLAVVPRLLRMIRENGAHSQAAFCCDDGEGFGFPFALRRSAVAVVANAIREESLSLQSMAGRLGARRVKLSQRDSWRRMNINTPEEFAVAKARLSTVRRRLGKDWPLHAPLVSMRGRVTLRP